MIKWIKRIWNNRNKCHCMLCCDCRYFCETDNSGNGYCILLKQEQDKRTSQAGNDMERMVKNDKRKR